VLGITHMFLHEWPTIREIATRAKAAIPGLVVVLGGENATSYWPWIFRETDVVDHCVLGEGERTMAALCERLAAGEPVAGLPGVASRGTHTDLAPRAQVLDRAEARDAFDAEDRDAPAAAGARDAARSGAGVGGASTITDGARAGVPSPRSGGSVAAGAAGTALLDAPAASAAPTLSRRSTDLGALPRPAWEYFPVERYMAHADNHGVNRGRSMPLLSTRGCPYRCTFCSSPDMWTTKYVTREPREVVDEIKDYIARYRIDNVNFCDLTAIVRRDWIVEFCRLLAAEVPHLTWQLPTGTRTEVLDEEVVALLHATGCRNITYAPENGSERMLKVIRKNVLLPRMLGSLRAAHKAGLVTRVNIIIGHPKEEWQDIRKSWKFLVKAAWTGCDDAAVMIFAPYPGSADFRELLAAGKVEMGEDYHYLALARSGFSSKTYNPVMSTRQLIFTQYVLLLAFYGTAYLSRPWRFVHVLASLVSGKETTQLDQLLRTKLQQRRKARQGDAEGAPTGSERAQTI
jgi:anaerobic magnesium-protoporphyrin IX monomethyl ester cyclase